MRMVRLRANQILAVESWIPPTLKSITFLKINVFIFTKKRKKKKERKREPRSTYLPKLEKNLETQSGWKCLSFKIGFSNKQCIIIRPISISYGNDYSQCLLVWRTGKCIQVNDHFPSNQFEIWYSVALLLWLPPVFQRGHVANRLLCPIMKLMWSFWSVVLVYGAPADNWW